MFDRLVTAIGGKIAYPIAALAVPEVVGTDVSEQAVKATLNKLTGKEQRILKPIMTDGGEGIEIFHDVLGLPVLDWKRNFEVKRESALKESSLASFVHTARGPAGRRRVEIAEVARLFDNFFKIDRYLVSYELYSGGMSQYVPRLNFERGDAVGVLAFNIDTRSVVLAEQFKLPTLIGRRRDSAVTQDGWIVEVMAGMIRGDETPEEAAIRETKEETGYIVESLNLICKFLSSPGGSSERIFLYFGTVSDSKRSGKGLYEVGDENIRVLEWNVDVLFESLARGQIEDPKLAIAANWLKDNLGRVEELTANTVKFRISGQAGIVGCKTGSIEEVKGVRAWVNSENTNMMMDRFTGYSISAKIRYLGSKRSEGDDALIEDTIQDHLREVIGNRRHVALGTVLVTKPGMLAVTHGVKLLFHVAAAEAGFGEASRLNPRRLKELVKRVLARVDRENNRFWRKFREDSIESIIFPMIGAGEGGVSMEVSAHEIIPAAIEYFLTTPNATIKEVYFSAFRLRDKRACDSVFSEYCDNKIISLVRD
jgi:ADP-ribose pyrophosphatase